LSSASFIGTDTSTQGSWKTVYGADGYRIAYTGGSDYISNPSYCTPTLSGQNQFTWSDPDSSVKALQRPGGSDRFAATDYVTNGNTQTWSFDTGSTTCQFSMYLLDWDGGGARNASIEIKDNLGNSLDGPRVVTGTNYANGIWYSWTITGNVVVYVTGNGAQAAVSGIFFDPSGGVTQALSGVQATASVGALAPSMSIALTGVSATGGVGTLTPVTGTSVALTGVQGTGAVGSIGKTFSIPLTGVASTGSVGTLTPVTGVTVALSGVQATGALGSLGNTFSIPLTGNQVTLTVGTLVPSTSGGSVSVALTGVSATVSVGSFRLSGVATGGGGRVRKLANFSQYQVESESEKLARRIKQGIIKPTPQTIEPVRLAERKAAIQQAIEIDTQLRQLRAEAAAHQAEMQRMEALNQERKSRLIEQAMLRKQQELQMAQLQEKAAQEQAEMLDVAYVAKAVMDMLAARNRQ
jgi:hypothetical protein